MIVDLNIDVDLNLLGKDYKFNEKVTINELKEGKVFLNGNLLGTHKNISRVVYILKLFSSG